MRSTVAPTVTVSPGSRSRAHEAVEGCQQRRAHHRHPRCSAPPAATSMPRVASARWARTRSSSARATRTRSLASSRCGPGSRPCVASAWVRAASRSPREERARALLLRGEPLQRGARRGDAGLRRAQVGLGPDRSRGARAPGRGSRGRPHRPAPRCSRPTRSKPTAASRWLSMCRARRPRAPPVRARPSPPRPRPGARTGASRRRSRSPGAPRRATRRRPAGMVRAMKTPRRGSFGPTSSVSRGRRRDRSPEQRDEGRSRPRAPPPGRACRAAAALESASIWTVPITMGASALDRRRRSRTSGPPPGPRGGSRVDVRDGSSATHADKALGRLGVGSARRNCSESIEADACRAGCRRRWLRAATNCARGAARGGRPSGGGNVASRTASTRATTASSSASSDAK
jgi:hypothetical protein